LFEASILVHCFVPRFCRQATTLNLCFGKNSTAMTLAFCTKQPLNLSQRQRALWVPVIAFLRKRTHFAKQKSFWCSLIPQPAK
jgi:hypothetical protein